MSHVEPSLEEPSPEDWKALYQAADAFRKKAPWKWMEDHDLFGVMNPETGEIGYCCVLGAGGQVFGFRLFPGTEGLEGYFDLLECAEGFPTDDWIRKINSLALSFGPRQDLDEQERKNIRASGLRLRGKTAWPQFNSHLPGHVPWSLDRDEARFLTHALVQALEIADETARDREFLDSDDEDMYYVCVRESDEQDGEWTGQWLKPTLIVEDVVISVAVDGERLEQLRRDTPQNDEIWEFDFDYAPIAIEGPERPYYPFLALWVDNVQGTVLGFHMADHNDYREEFLEVLVDLLDKAAARPSQIWVWRDEAADLLAPAARILGIEIVTKEQLDNLEEARAGLAEYLASGPR